MATPKNILIVSADGGIYIPEPIANETIKPGHLLRYVGLHTNAQMKVGLHASAAGTTYPMFAIEPNYSSVQGSATARIDLPYASGDSVHAYVAERGARIYAFLAAGNVVTAGTRLDSAGGGELKIAVGPYGVAVAVEAVTTTSAAARIQVE